MPSRKQVLAGMLILVLGVGGCGPASGQVAGGGSGGTSHGTYALEDGERNLKFAGVPIPGYSEVMGWNLGIIGMAYYKMDRHDDDLPPSSTGVVGFYSQNKSWVGLAFQRFHFDQDNWRATAALGTGSIKYQFNPSSVAPILPDVFLDYTTVSDFLILRGSRRVWDKVYLGIDAVTWSAALSTALELDLIPTERYTSLGPSVEWDRRNHIMYPTEGFMAKLHYYIHDENLGSDRDYRKLEASLSGYTTVGDTTRVVAARILTESASGDVPFSGQAILNGKQNLRGYADGRYRGDMLLTLEAEYRWNFMGRWTAAGFGGVGFVDDSWSDFSLGDILPAAGFGLRFRMVESYKINARVDYAWGKQDRALYVSIGEAF